MTGFMKGYTCTNFLDGDTAKNEPYIKFSPIEKFRNDHIGHLNKFKNDQIGQTYRHDIRSTASSTNSNELKQLKYPLSFRQWPDPPPPPRKGFVEKQTCCIKRRPGSADPRFHRHLGNLEKHKITTTSEKSGKRSIIKDIADDETFCDRKPKLRSANFCNFKIRNVNDWLDNQTTFNPEDYEKNFNESTKLLDSKYSQTDKNKVCTEDSTDSTGRELTCIKDFSTILQEKEDFGNDTEYKETINLSPNDVMHKYPDFSKNFFEMAESEASFVTELTAKVLSQGDDTHIDNIIVKNTMPMLVQANLLDEIYEKNKSINPVIKRADSQLSLKFSNTLSTNSFYLEKDNIDILSRYTSIKLMIYLTLTIALVLSVNYLFTSVYNMLLWKPEETLVEKYVINPIKHPAFTMGKIFKKIIDILSIPNKFNVDPYIV